MKASCALLGLLLCASAAPAADWPDNPRLSGNSFLPPGLLALQADKANSPVSMWLDRGAALWTARANAPSCQDCHGSLGLMRGAAPSYPRLSADGQALINLEDQIVACSRRSGSAGLRLEDDEVLALSAALHGAAAGQAIDLKPPPEHSMQWQAHLARGTELFGTRIGRMNLACMHCHTQNVGRQIRADVVSPANPTGFPIYRMTWQRLGSIDRRLRACFAGVQAVQPAAGDVVLRELELYLKVRANGMPLEGPSIRR